MKVPFTLASDGMEIIMKKKNKNKQQINPEIQREEEEKYRSLNFYDEDDGLGMTLYTVTDKTTRQQITTI